MSVRGWQCVAGLSGFVAVSMGAVAAHAFTMLQLMALLEKASLYQFIHTLALLWLVGKEGWAHRISRWCFLFGILLFCGSLYGKAFYWPLQIQHSTPTGGCFLIAGWLFLAYGKRTCGMQKTSCGT